MLLRALAVDSGLSHAFLEDLMGCPHSVRTALITSSRLMRWRVPDQVQPRRLMQRIMSGAVTDVWVPHLPSDVVIQAAWLHGGVSGRPLL